MNSKDYQVAFVMLAGGQSSRYRGNKLLSAHPNSKRPLIQHCLGEVISARDEIALVGEPPITVVTGKWHDSVKNHLSLHAPQFPVSIIYNASWEEGIASSIRTGLKHVLNTSSSVTEASEIPRATHVLFTLGDLPSLNADDLTRLINASKAKPSNIVCSEWRADGETQSRLTVPAIFPETVFRELLALKGDVGANPVINKYLKLDAVTAVSIPNAQYDIDTPQDWKNLKKRG